MEAKVAIIIMSHLSDLQGHEVSMSPKERQLRFNFVKYLVLEYRDTNTYIDADLVYQKFLDITNFLKIKTMANLCKCNNCDSILIDQNPQVNAIEFELRGNETDMIKVDGFWACPVCKTDDFLSDIIEV